MRLQPVRATDPAVGAYSTPPDRPPREPHSRCQSVASIIGPSGLRPPPPSLTFSCTCTYGRYGSSVINLAFTTRVVLI